MKRVFPILVALTVLLAFVATLGFLVWKAREKPVEYKTESPAVTDIVLKTVATGAIVPRNEVEIKSRVSGVVDRVAVRPGAQVQAGDLIAVIRIIPDVQALSSAESRVEMARIARARARDQLARDEALYESRAISIAQIEATRSDAALAEEEHRVATRNLRIVREGHAGGSVGVATHITSTVEGMVLSIDVEPGVSVTETNTFSEGTTIGTVADMNDMMFSGMVDESEVGKIREGLPLDIKVGALADQKFAGTLEYISPKGLAADGAIQFAIEASVTVPEDVFIRAGSSANAAIVLDRADQVLAIKESLLKFDKRKPYVEVEVAPQVFERRDIEVGLSDGIQIQIKSGLTAEDRVKGAPIGG